MATDNPTANLEAGRPEPRPNKVGGSRRAVWRIFWIVCYGLFSALVTWAANVYMIAVAGGFNDDPLYPIGVSTRSSTNAVLFWSASSALVFACVGFLRRGGFRRLARQFIQWPVWILSLLRSVWAKVGLFVGLVVGWWLAPSNVLPWVVTLFAVVLVMYASSTLLGSLCDWIAHLSRRAWKRVKFESRAESTFTQFVRGGFLGGALALLVSLWIGREWLLGIVGPVLAVLWLRRDRPSYAPLLLLVGALTATTISELFWGSESVAYADDGTFRERGSAIESWQQWWSESGADRVREMATEPAVPAGVNGSVGGVVGEGAGQPAPEERKGFW